MDLSPVSQPQFDMFDRQDRGKQQSLMQALDGINRRWGSDTLFYAGSGIARRWKMQRGMKSPHYTTEWGELLEIAVK